MAIERRNNRKVKKENPILEKYIPKYNKVKILISSKTTADVYFNDKVVRILGELGREIFWVPHPVNMKWMKPKELKNKALTISEQQEIINVVNAYYGEEKNQIYFEDVQ